MKLIKKNLIVITMLLCGIGAGVVSFMYMGDLLEPHQQVEVIKEEELEKPPEQNEERADKSQEEWLELPRKRNTVVLIDNDKNARPQAGISNADLVYELPIEGGTTRFMAIYSRFGAENIGPIRSARDYIIDIAKEHDPIFVHAGGSPEAFAKFAEIGNLNGLEGGVDRAFWRIKEREAPHNLYSDTETLYRVAAQEGFREHGKLTDFVYLVNGEEFSEKETKQISINYGHPDFQAEFFYDEKSNRYLRFTGGVKHFDDISEQIAVKNIIIQRVNTKVKDDKGRLALDLNGRGNAIFFTQGKFVAGYWEKKSNQNTKYYKASGEEIKLTPGKTWISVVPISAKVVY